MKRTCPHCLGLGYDASGLRCDCQPQTFLSTRTLVVLGVITCLLIVML